MISYCKDNLLQIKNLTAKISDECYQKPCEILFKASLGQHIRHTLEFYLCLLKGLEMQVVNYDNRKRQRNIESSPKVATQVIEHIMYELNQIDKNIKIEIQANYTSGGDDEICMHSSLFRELGFCLEHSIHHQALVKSGLKELNALNLVSPDFGVAPSTLRNQKQCVQ